MKFLGYARPDGKVGIRNHTLIVSTGRNSATLAILIAQSLKGAKVFATMQESGRTAEDRATVARTIVGLAKNPNVGAVLIVGIKKNGGYPEFTYEKIVGEIEQCGKPMDTLFLEDCGGFTPGIGEGFRKGRNLMVRAGESYRQEVDLGKLFMGVKCGYSDGTSGLSGNPVVGDFFDRVVDAGGSALFSETTEVIGAEHIVAKRFESPDQRQKFLAAVKRVEEESKATGEDIRSINPIPANIAAGLTTLEEKSLGAIAKSGKRPMKQCVIYAEPTTQPGMHFMDAWMSSSALFLGLAATGSVLNIFQVGGGWMPKGALMPSADSGLVSPTLYMTGNPRCYENAFEEMDFNAGTVISERETITSAGERLAKTVCAIASGKPTKGECMGVSEPLEVYFRGPAL